jgi:MATE family multidrug resistance protein
MLRLAVPVVLAELGWMTMGVVDSVMVGRVGPEPLGGVGIGRGVFMAAMVAGIGLLLGLDTVVARAHGARDARACNVWLLHGVYLSVLVAVPLTAGLLSARAWFGALDLHPEVLASMRPYFTAMCWSVLPLLLYTAFRRYLQAVNRVRAVMIALVSANVVNVVANWILIYGRLGFPAMGAAGAGWATFASSWYMAVFLLGVILLLDREEGTGLLRTPRTFERARIARLVGLGGPAALQLALEVGVFATATALAGRLAPADLAAHHIALTLASITFMVPLGVASAAAVRVGQLLGSGDPAGARQAGWAALWLGTTFMIVSAAAFLVVPRPLLGAFTTDAAVVAIGVRLLAVAALFQLFDGLQVVSTGALRGAGDTRTPMVTNLVGHWLVGLPVGAWLCFGAGWGVIGLWVGWLVGLGAVGAFLVGVWARASRRDGLAGPRDATALPARIAPEG